MLKIPKKKSFDEMTITEKDAEIKRFEKKLKTKRILYKISIPITVISMISTIVFIVMLLLVSAKKIEPGGWISGELIIGLWMVPFVLMIISVHVFVPIYWFRFIRAAFDNISENRTGDTGIDLIITGVFVSVPAAVVICAAFFASGFYCLKRTSDLKKSITELTERIARYKSKIYPCDGDFEIISAYKM